ncbi:glycosyl hydrolase family 28-related protein [Luteolibacter sp. SL250]|uniref:right-handed parallel beta-helix repeat-containing protein n=1 Tax=Luteolibacter sp. SL250 TaxID=2995170 RepID=UPI002271436D|nr:right-handed parallel beta-helix repeat-containing protein [Luteolibacter sp. SL250]WAC20879.1 glycosyl hydrolase family 28-related protein [Luteolibacter sp. SL250]
MMNRLLPPTLAAPLLLLAFCPPLSAAGAKTPFTTVEAESGNPGGGAAVKRFIIGSPVPTVSTKELEASGGAYVTLSRTGDSISWRNPVAGANTIVIRSCIPDTDDGSGQESTINLYVDGKFRQAITVSSRQSWVYRKAAPVINNPQGGGMPYHFYNEDRAILAGPPIPANATVELRKDAANGAEYYDIDCIDFEKIAPPLPRPENSLSVLDFGADPAFQADSTEAIARCIDTARAEGKSVWIPAGKFMLNSLKGGGLNLTGVTVNGAGMWHTMLYRNIPLPPPKLPWRSNISLGTGSVLRDVSIGSNAIYKAIGGVSGDDYGVTSSGENWLIERIWVQHCDAQWLSGSNGVIRDSRVADSWADGINVNNGNTPSPNKRGMNLTVQNNFVRGAGDDGIAAFSDAGSKGDNSQMDGTRILNNTTVATWWANGLRIAGGKNVVVKDNLIMDVAANNGMEISIFGDTSQPLESATITGNVIHRGGGWNTIRHGINIGGGENVQARIVFSDNVIIDSRRMGVKVGGKLLDLTFRNNVIRGSASTGILIGKGMTGRGIFSSNRIIEQRDSLPEFTNESPSTFRAELSNNAW